MESELILLKKTLALMNARLNELETNQYNLYNYGSNRKTFGEFYLVASWFEWNVKTIETTSLTAKTILSSDQNSLQTIETALGSNNKDDNICFQYFELKTGSDIRDNINYNLRCASLFLSSLLFNSPSFNNMLIDKTNNMNKLDAYLYLHSNEDQDLCKDDISGYGYVKKLASLLKIFYNQNYQPNDSSKTYLLMTNPIISNKIVGTEDQRLKQTLIFKQLDIGDNNDDKTSSSILVHHKNILKLYLTGYKNNIWPRLIALLEYVIVFILLSEHKVLMTHVYTGNEVKIHIVRSNYSEKKNNNGELMFKDFNLLFKDISLEISEEDYVEKCKKIDLSTLFDKDYLYLDKDKHEAYLNYDYFNYFVINLYKTISEYGFLEVDEQNVRYLNNNSLLNFSKSNKILNKSHVLKNFILEHILWLVSFAHNTCVYQLVNDISDTLNKNTDSIIVELYKTYKKYKSITKCEIPDFYTELYKENYTTISIFNQFLPSPPKIIIKEDPPSDNPTQEIDPIEVLSTNIFNNISIASVDESIKLKELFIDDSNENNYSIKVLPIKETTTQ